MASFNRPYLFKAAFLLCILLLLLLNFSNFRTNNPIRYCSLQLQFRFDSILMRSYCCRASHTVANGIFWPTPLHLEMNAKRSATNQNVSKQILVNNNHRTGNASNKMHSNNLSTLLVKPTQSIIETGNESEQ